VTYLLKPIGQTESRSRANPNAVNQNVVEKMLVRVKAVRIVVQKLMLLVAVVQIVPVMRDRDLVEIVIENLKPQAVAVQMPFVAMQVLDQALKQVETEWVHHQVVQIVDVMPVQDLTETVVANLKLQAEADRMLVVER
jgi:hypothetical protein